MKENIVNFIDENSTISALIFLIIGIVLLIFKLTSKEKLSFKKHNILSWKEYVYTWAVIIMSFTFALIIFLR